MSTVRIVSQSSSSMFERPGAMHVSKEDIGKMMLNWSADQVDMIIVTDGSGLSGVDDIGVGGVSIVVGKMDFYVAAAGINPQRVLPVIIDVGTNSQKLFDDPLYRGLQESCLKGEEYFAVINEFIGAVSARWSNVMVQFEHIESNLGFQILERYKSSHRVFNDNIQGATVVTIAGLLGAVRAQGGPMSDFANQKIIVAAAGRLEVVNAAIGTMRMIAGKNDTTFDSSRKQFWIVDTKGLITENRPSIHPDTHPLARKKNELICEGLCEGASFIEVVKKVSPDIVLLLSSVAGLSSQEILQAIKYSSSSRPAVFTISGAQCTAEEAFTIIGENVVFASGDQFPNVDLGAGKIGYSNHINKVYLFPGIALGTLLSGARQISDEMIYAAAICLASLVEEKDVLSGILYPPISSIRDITKEVATAVLIEAVAEGLAEGYGAMDAIGLANLSKEKVIMYIEDNMWSPSYPT